MDTPNNLDVQKSAEQVVGFMLTEYETLRTFRQDLISHGENRFSFFLAILSGTAVFLTWMNQLSGYQEIAYFVTGVVIVGVFLLGLTTFARITRRNTSIVVYTRGLSRIRCYFVEQHPDIKKYIILPINDDQPSFRSISTSEQLPIMLTIINCLVASTGVSVFARAILSWSMIAATLIGMGLFITLFLAHLKYYNVRMKARANELEVHFPTTT